MTPATEALWLACKTAATMHQVFYWHLRAELAFSIGEALGVALALATEDERARLQPLIAGLSKYAEAARYYPSDEDKICFDLDPELLRRARG